MVHRASTTIAMLHASLDRYVVWDYIARRKQIIS
jgi:hypothetical protein